MAHILLCEDDLQFRTMLALMLMRDGHQIATANNGIDGLSYYFRQWPDLVITDILMPEKNGLEVIDNIRENNPDTPIIAISGGNKNITTESCLSQAKALGANYIFIKPFRLDDLRKVINYVLKR